MNVIIEPDAAFEIARRSRGTPRIANRLLKRVRDFAQVKGDGVIRTGQAGDVLTMLDIDYLGLDEMDKRYLSALIEKYDGGPVGIETLAVTIAEEAETLEDMYEPFLIQLGFIKRTAKGRVATKLAYEHLGFKKIKSSQDELF